MTYHIVAGVDGSPHSLAALRWSLTEAAARSTEVTAIYAWQIPFLSTPGAFNRAELEKASKDFLIAAVSEVARATKIPLRTVTAEGDPMEALIAASKHANLLVLGIRGRSPFKQLMLGSVSQACAAYALCPVVLVKPTDQAPAAPDWTGLTQPEAPGGTRPSA
jgi:nucleotide-binding universal stress UspA family protein